MRAEELKDKLEKHRKWLNDEFGGERADLCGANLYGANLCEANLCEANLRGANLCEANLRGANLYGTNLYGANLCEADLYGANLYGANLCEANLYGANLRGANLRGADLYRAKEVPYIPMACPDEGSFIGWKKVQRNGANFLVKLEIPADARRSSATGRKCRCDKAMVLEITHMISKQPVDVIVNYNYSPSMTYKVGEMVYPDSFDENRFNECSHGIHFFINKQEAIDYEI